MPEFRYRLHGLDLSTERPLPTLERLMTAGTTDAAVFIRMTPPWNGTSPRVELLGRLDFADGILARSLERVTSGTQCWLVQRFNMDLALAFAEDGREVHIFGAPVQDLDYVASCVAGPVASFLRWMRGWPSLHASSVVVDGRVLAVGGPPGSGKSTTIAVLASLGHRVFSDDVLGWRNAGQGLVASAGPVRLKLWPDTLSALGIDPGTLPRVRQDLDKRVFSPHESAQDSELPLHVVYLLATAPDAGQDEIRELRGAEAFTALKANCRDDAVLTSEMRERQFEALADLARSAHVRQVRAHGGLERIRGFANALVEDFRRLPAGVS